MEIVGADQLPIYRTAAILFSQMQKAVFLMTWLISWHMTGNWGFNHDWQGSNCIFTWAMSWESQCFAYAKTKTQISFVVTTKLISAFVFATWIVQYLYFLNPKFQAFGHLQWLFSPVCVRPCQKPRTLVFSCRISLYFSVVVDEIQVQTDHGLECGFKNIYTVAEHYNIYKDLYGDAYFYPNMQLRIAYDIDEEYVNPVCTGNILDPAEVQWTYEPQHEKTNNVVSDQVWHKQGCTTTWDG